MAGILAGIKKVWAPGECELQDIPDDVLAQELLRRKRIQWFMIDKLVTQVGTDRAELIQHERNEMMYQIGHRLLRDRVTLFNQRREPQCDEIRLTLALPVFIRT